MRSSNEEQEPSTIDTVFPYQSAGDLPVTLDRIERQLATPPRSGPSQDGLKIECHVEVYRQVPKIKLFMCADNLPNAPAMYGMTHQESLNVVTRQEFRAPAADVSAAIGALIKWYAIKRLDDAAKRRQ